MRLLLNIVDKATVETTTIDMTAERPPKKTKTASHLIAKMQGNKKRKIICIRLIS